ncbi:hypothetical protein FRB93_006614 [Tulasnella sp. JGI-2019a]|nr:hypothetical protein FRB93_006614 [Tulasnella sp. JGI-2019a]
MPCQHRSKRAELVERSDRSGTEKGNFEMMEDREAEAKLELRRHREEGDRRRTSRAIVKQSWPEIHAKILKWIGKSSNLTLTAALKARVRRTNQVYERRHRKGPMRDRSDYLEAAIIYMMPS